MKKMIVLSLLAFTGLGLFAGKYAPIYNADFELDGDYTSKQVQVAIKKALIGRGWSVKKTEGDKVHATLLIRSHTAKVVITYSATNVKIDYVDSTNLGYRVKKGEPLIHRNYNKWVMTIERDIQNKLFE